MEKLIELGIMGETNILPQSPELIYGMLNRLIKSKKMTAEKFLELYEAQILKYKELNPKYLKYYETLGFLYASTGQKDKLKEIDLYGWKAFGLEKFANSYLVGLDFKSDEFKEAFKAAKSDFPTSITISDLNYSLLNPKSKQALAQFVAAQFTNVKNNWAGPYRLSDFMASLKHEMDKLENSD